MSPATLALEDMTLNVVEEIRVHASLEDTFAALLDELGPNNTGMHDTPMPMVLEAWPGGRWYRDLGDSNGHCWGQVQAIRRPVLLEIAGPLMMSFAVSSNVQYRLTESNGDTLITLKHNALGLFPDGYRANLAQGWRGIFRRVQARLG